MIDRETTPHADMYPLSNRPIHCIHCGIWAFDTNKGVRKWHSEPDRECYKHEWRKGHE